MTVSCYRIRVDSFPNLVWFTLAESPSRAREKILPLALKLGLLPRSLLLQDWSDSSLESLFTSGAFPQLDPKDKLTVLVDAMRNIAKTMSRTADYLEIQQLINSIAQGLV
jgi:hypothetical protein